MELHFIRIGLLINSALYLAGCFVAGLLLANPPAWKCALASAGVAYLAYFAQDVMQSFRSGGLAFIGIFLLVIASIAFGIGAGLALLFG